MPENKEISEVIHRIEPISTCDSQAKFDELVRLLGAGTDTELIEHLQSFHHSDLADAFGLLDRSLRKKLVETVKPELDPDLLFELEDHLRKEVTDSLTPEEVAEVITEMESDEAVQVLEDMEEDERAEVLSSVPKEEREDIEIGLAFPEDSAGRRDANRCGVGWNELDGQTIDYLREERDLPEEFLDLFVVDENARPVGVISLSRILRSPRNT